MRTDHFARPLRAALFLAGLASATAAFAQPADAPNYGAGTSYAPPPMESRASEAPAEAAPAETRRPRRTRSWVQPYLEVAQVVSAELDGGDTLTYTSVAAGIDGRIETQRVTVQASYRYQRNIEWEGEVGDEDLHTGIAQLNAQVVPGLLDFDAGALAARTAGEGRAIGTTDRDGSIEVYSAYAGPTLSTHAGPVAINAAYRLGYVEIDDDRLDADLVGDMDSSVTHNVTASVGMAPGQAPVGWTVGGGYVRTDTNSDFDERFEAAYVRGDVVVPVSPTFAVTAGVGYEDIEANQRDIARDSNGAPILGPDGFPVADPNAPRLLTYDIDGIIYDAGFIWRPTARTELQARAGHRYGGTTFVGSLTHQFQSDAGLNLTVFDTVETFGNLLINDLSTLPDNFETVINPLTGNMGGCVFGAEPGSGVCLARSLQSIRGSTFRMRGGSLIVSGNRGLWDWGLGATYVHRRFGDEPNGLFDLIGPGRDETFSLYGSIGRRLSRSSEIGFDAYASWYDTDEVGIDRIFSAGATTTYSRDFLLQRLRLIAALGLYHSDDGVADSSVASGLLGLRYTF